ncbi:GntR family transcriptional regulator [Kineosporia sp. J2-2]|uniref:GntR family transcriptional regulator n=1 Tax=Kineosporia corallincola TaxID=2835133 RepID=A0ABS5TGI8_9ACTN|nr:GntR family transcriptional regulator [Kineosporia corallincola]MBT0769973.1 GntR family transcriptional regulator [Kineosporia corallincola]
MSAEDTRMSARDAIYSALRRRLMAGHYREAGPLVPTALSEEFGVSRTPVREALALLERDGLLIAGSRGFTVRRRSIEETLEIFEVRAVLDSAAASAAALQRSSIDLAKLEELHRRATAVTDADGTAPDETAHQAVRALFNQWHDCIRAAAHNRTILSVLHTLDAQVKSSAPWTPAPAATSFADSHAEHARILDAIRRTDAEAARTEMLDHLARDRDVRVRHLVAQSLELPGDEAGPVDGQAISPRITVVGLTGTAPVVRAADAVVSTTGAVISTSGPVANHAGPPVATAGSLVSAAGSGADAAGSAFGGDIGSTGDDTAPGFPVPLPGECP